MSVTRLVATAVLSLGLVAAGPGEVHALRSGGYGPVQAGMTVAEAQAALGVELVAADDSSPADGCWHLMAKTGHDGVTFMIQDGRVTRASLYGDPTKVRTAKGVGLDDHVSRVRSLYGRPSQDEPHTYDGPEGRYLTYWAAPNRGLRFEVVEGKVSVIHAGDESIRLVEGCS